MTTYRAKMWVRDQREAPERNKNGRRKLPRESEIVVEGDDLPSIVRSVAARLDRVPAELRSEIVKVSIQLDG